MPCAPAAQAPPLLGRGHFTITNTAPAAQSCRTNLHVGLHVAHPAGQLWQHQQPFEGRDAADQALHHTRHLQEGRGIFMLSLTVSRAPNTVTITTAQPKTHSFQGCGGTKPGPAACKLAWTAAVDSLCFHRSYICAPCAEPCADPRGSASCVPNSAMQDENTPASVLSCASGWGS